MSVALRPDDLVLVTGGSGFLGSAVVRALIARGSRVRAIVRSSSPPDNLAGLGCEIVTGDLTDRQSLAAALRGVRYPVPCRGGLSLLGARSFGHPARQCRGHAQPDAGSAVGRRRADRLYEQRRGAEGGGCPWPGRRDGAAAVGRGHRRLQAQQDPGRAGGRGNDRARQAARHHRQSDDADRAARHQADADRPHPARCGARQDPGLRRHRTELCPCRRHRRGPPAGLRARPDRRTLHPGRRERPRCATCSPALPASPAAARRASACRACRFTRWRSAPRRSRA